MKKNAELENSLDSRLPLSRNFLSARVAQLTFNNLILRLPDHYSGFSLTKAPRRFQLIPLGCTYKLSASSCFPPHLCIHDPRIIRPEVAASEAAALCTTVCASKTYPSWLQCLDTCLQAVPLAHFKWPRARNCLITGSIQVKPFLGKYRG